MLITSLLPLLSRYSLGLDLVAGPDDTITLTILPRRAAGAKHTPEGGEVRPISITAPAAEIDAELAKGVDGALGQLITARKALADQLAEQQTAAEDAKATAAKKATPAAKPAAKPAAAEKPPVPVAPVSPPPVESKPGEPVSLW